MKTSNKVLCVLVGVLGILFFTLFLSFKPEYRRTSIRNIDDKYSVVLVESGVHKANEVIFSTAPSREESYIYYEKDDCRVKPWLRSSNDTLYIMRPDYTPVLKPGTPLYLHLKGVDKVMLKNEIIYSREP